jgi:hypothetical protein
MLSLCILILFNALLVNSYSTLTSGPTDNTRFIVTTPTINASVAEGISFSVKAIKRMISNSYFFSHFCKADGATDTSFTAVLTLLGVMGNDTIVSYYDRGDASALWTKGDATSQLEVDTVIGAIGTTSSFRISNNDHNLNSGWLHSLGSLQKPTRLSYFLRITEKVKACGYISLREYRNYQ